MPPSSTSSSSRPSAAPPPAALPAEKIFSVQIGSRVFKLSGASIMSDAPSYFSQYFERQLRRGGNGAAAGSGGSILTLYLDRDPETFAEIARHLQGYHVQPQNGREYARIFADAQFYSLPRLTSQLFENDILISIGHQDFRLPRSLLNQPNNSPNYFTHAVSLSFASTEQTFPGLDRNGLLRPPSIQPLHIDNRDPDIFRELLKGLHGYDLDVRNEAHRAALLRDCKYYQFRGLEQRLIPHEISYNPLRQTSEIVIKLEHIRPAGLTFGGGPGGGEAHPLGSDGWLRYSRPNTDEPAHELILQIDGGMILIEKENMRMTPQGHLRALLRSFAEAVKRRFLEFKRAAGEADGDRTAASSPAPSSMREAQQQQRQSAGAPSNAAQEVATYQMFAPKESWYTMGGLAPWAEVDPPNPAPSSGARQAAPAVAGQTAAGRAAVGQTAAGQAPAAQVAAGQLAARQVAAAQAAGGQPAAAQPAAGGGQAAGGQAAAGPVTAQTAAITQAAQAAAAHNAAAQLAAMQSAVAQVRAAQAAAGQANSPQAAAAQLAAAETAAAQVAAAQNVSAQFVAAQAASPQFTAAQIVAVQNAAAQVAAGHATSVQTASPQVTTAQLAAMEVQLAAARNAAAQAAAGQAASPQAASPQAAAAQLAAALTTASQAASPQAAAAQLAAAQIAAAQAAAIQPAPRPALGAQPAVPLVSLAPHAPSIAPANPPPPTSPTTASAPTATATNPTALSPARPPQKRPRPSDLDADDYPIAQRNTSADDVDRRNRLHMSPRQRRLAREADAAAAAGAAERRTAALAERRAAAVAERRAAATAQRQTRIWGGGRRLCLGRWCRWI